MIRLGHQSAHTSTSRALWRPRALAYADGIGAEAIQVFVSNPRAWSPPLADETEAQALARRAAAAGLPVFVHAPYLVNLGSGDERTAALSAETVGLTLDRAARIGARGVVVHAGAGVPAGTVRAPCARWPTCCCRCLTSWARTIRPC